MSGMITSIVLSDRHRIGISKSGKMYINNDKKLKVGIKEIPFVRYRFNEYNENDRTYIRNMMEQFPYSVHMVEMSLNDIEAGMYQKVFEQNGVNGEEPLEDYVAKYVYIEITDNEVKNNFSEEQLDRFERLLDGLGYDRLMLRDNSRELFTVAANRLKAQLMDRLGVDERTLGICSSPLSVGDDACLSAIRARELAAIYNTSENCISPSANHQCMNNCGCIKYIVITQNCNAPEEKSVVMKKNKSANEKHPFIASESGDGDFVMPAPVEEATKVKEVKPKIKKAPKKAIPSW